MSRTFGINFGACSEFLSMLKNCFFRKLPALVREKEKTILNISKYYASVGLIRFKNPP